MMKFDLSIIYTRPDGSYVINNGLYHVPNEGDYADLWAQVDAYAKEHPEAVQPEPVEETPEPTPEEQEAALQKQYTRLIQSILDNEAYKLGYTGPDENVAGACLSVCSYRDTGVQKFDDEGAAFRKWRSAVWAKGYEILALVKAGEMAIPTEDELMEMLPKLEIVYTE